MKKILNSTIVFLLIAIPSAAQQLNFPQDTVAYNDLFNNRQFTAFDSDGKMHIVYSASQGTNSASREIYYAKEDEFGNYFPQNISNNTVDDNYPTLSLNHEGKVNIGFIGRDAANNFQVKYTNNYNGNFFVPIFITAGGLNKATPYSKVGPDSVVHFVFFTYTTGADYVYYTKYFIHDSSMQLTPTLLCDGETGGDFDAALDVDNNGAVHIVVKSGLSTGGALRYYTDASGILQEVVTGVQGNIVTPKVTVDKNNIVHIIYRAVSDLRLYYINNSSGSFSTPIAITPSGQRPSGYQNFAIDDSNNIFVIYQSSVSASGKGFYLVHGKNQNFSDTILVYNLTPEYVTRNSSTVIARGNGEIAMTYSPGAVRNSLTICDIFLKRGRLFGNSIIAASRDSINFGSIRINTLKSDSFFIYNHGSDTLKIDSVAVTNPAFVNQLPVVIDPVVAPNDSLLLTIPFHPTIAQLYEGELRVYSNAGNINPFAVNLKGRGINPPTLTLDRDTVYFSAISGWADSLLFTNTGDEILRIDSLGRSSDSSIVPLTDLINFSLNPNESRLVWFYFIILGENLFDFADSFYVYSNDPITPKKRIVMLYDSLPSSTEKIEDIPDGFALYQNYPNPFNPTTIISYQLSSFSNAVLKIYDVLGKEVAVLIDNELKEKGRYIVNFDASNLSSGVYLYELVANDYRAVKKLMVIK